MLHQPTGKALTHEQDTKPRAALVHTVIEYASIDGGRIIVGAGRGRVSGCGAPSAGGQRMLRQVAKAAAVARDGPGEVDLSALGLHEMAASLPDYVRMVAAGERGFASASRR